MSRLRYYVPPGGRWKTVTPGRVWYSECAPGECVDDHFLVCALLSGAWGGADLQAKHGPWDEDQEQLWTVIIRKDVVHTYTTARFEIDPVTHPVWDLMYCELGNKPHRAIGYGVRDGMVLSRLAAPIGGTKLIDYRLVWYETPADRRAVRLWAQARVKRSEARRRRSKRLRRGLERGEWQKKPRRYNRWQRRRDQKDARW